MTPAQLVVVSFALVIGTGAVLLMAPFAQTRHLDPVDALFLATSAVCVTGLSPIDPGSTLSFWGQLILLGLIQLGGLGYMTISTFLAMVLNYRLSVLQRLTVEIMMGELVETWRLVRYAVVFTALAELLGALLLFFAFGRYELPLPVRAWFALFHSVSAFCNAGLDVFGLIGQERGWGGSLQPFATDPFVVLTIALLLMLGGIGFPVVVEVVDHLRQFRRRWTQEPSPPLLWSVHARTVFMVNGCLWLGGMVFLWLFEHNNPRTIAHQPFANQLLSCFFQSATARTAGFSTVPIGELTAASLWLLCLWMFVGASPAGTGGGIKTTTLAVLVATAWSGLKARDQVVLFKRSIPPEQLAKATLFAFLAANVVGVTTFVLCLTEGRLLEQGIPYGGFSLLFEAVSAFGTVGLSTGITSALSVAGKLALIVTMFVGRVGLLTLLFAIVGQRSVLIRYPRGDILIG